MTKRERKAAYYADKRADHPFCFNCKRYFHHFNEVGNKVNCGHCAYPRLKHREPYDTCERFERKEGLR